MKSFCSCICSRSLRLFPSLRSGQSRITAQGGQRHHHRRRLLKHIKVLASDEFEGRAPGSKGEDLSVKYISEQFKTIGLKPGNPNGSLHAGGSARRNHERRRQLSFTVGGKSSRQLEISRMITSPHPRDCRKTSRWRTPTIVFVGYGIVAPEYGWDDYKGVDVRGKTILMLINDPPIPDPNDPSKLDRENVQRPRHDLLRALDLQIRNRRAKRRGRRRDHPRNRAGGVSVFGRSGRVGRRRISRSMRRTRTWTRCRCVPGSRSMSRRNCSPTAARISTR